MLPVLGVDADDHDADADARQSCEGAECADAHHDALAGEERELAADDLEVAVLERGDERRSFRRLPDSEISSLLE